MGNTHIDNQGKDFEKMLGNLAHQIRAFHITGIAKAVSVVATTIVASAVAIVSDSNSSSSESEHINAESRGTDNVHNHCCYNLYSREIKKQLLVDMQ